jgi:hypothetical protein
MRPEPVQPGFYKHYKHDQEGASLNYFYEVVGIAKGTEDESMHVICRPLYESEFLGEAQFFSRPLSMFIEEVVVEGKRMPRFERITDPEIVEIIRKKIS